MRELDDVQKDNLRLSQEAFRQVKNRLPKQDQRDINDFINRHNEFGLGIETLMSALAEEKIAITAEELSSLEQACKAMGLMLQEGLIIED